MAHSTHSLNIQSVLWGVTFMMVIILGWFATSTQQTTNKGQFFAINCPPYSSPGIYFVCIIGFLVLWMFSPPTFHCFCLSNLSLFALMITFSNRFAFRALAMKGYARFAIMMKSALVRFVSIKFGNRLNYLAFRTFFCYDLLRHGLFLSKRLCFEPLEGRSLCGSFYCITQHKTYQGIFRNNLCVCQSS